MSNFKDYVLTGDEKYLEKHQKEFNSYLDERVLFGLIKKLDRLGKCVSLKVESGNTYAYILDGSYFSPEIGRSVKSIKEINSFIGKHIYGESINGI